MSWNKIKSKLYFLNAIICIYICQFLFWRYIFFYVLWTQAIPGFTTELMNEWSFMLVIFCLIFHPNKVPTKHDALMYSNCTEQFEDSSSLMGSGGLSFSVGDCHTHWNWGYNLQFCQGTAPLFSSSRARKHWSNLRYPYKISKDTSHTKNTTSSVFFTKHSFANSKTITINQV